MRKVYLNPEVRSGLGEDTFWTWFHRELSDTFDCQWYNGEELSDNDVLIQYSTKGAAQHKNAIGLCWELYPEMERVLGVDPEWSRKIQKIHECIETCRINLVPTELVASTYDAATTVLPIGVDTDLFHPKDDKESLRKKYNIDTNKKIGVWVGTSHVMKGFDCIDWNLADEWIIVWKNHSSRGITPSNVIAHEYIKVNQEVLCELMNCADFFCASGRLRPFFLSEYEAMAVDLPIVITGEKEKDFTITGSSRENLFNLGWSRKQVKEKWIKLIDELT